MEYYGIGLGRHAIIFGREETVDFPHFLDTMDSLQDAEDKFIRNVNLYNIPVFIIHGKKDTKVKYFLSMSFSQQIQKKLEWFTKNEQGTAKLLRLLQNSKRNNKEWEFCELIKQYRWDE